MSTTRTTNFAVLQEHDEQLLRLGMLAEKYFTEDPNSALLKLRQFAELLAQVLASRVGMLSSPQEHQRDLLMRLQDAHIIPDEIAPLFHEVRRAGNAATHALRGDHHTALTTLKLCWQLGLWFHRTFKNPSFKSGPFIPPQPPPDESDALRAEMNALTEALEQYQRENAATAERLEATEAQLREASDEKTFWEQLAQDVEREKVALSMRLTQHQTVDADAPKLVIKRAQAAVQALVLDEADTRKLIDAQLRMAGWDADSATITYAKGLRPEKGFNRAIAEWPTASGPVDYALFVGLKPVAVVEAKRKTIDVASAVQQAKRYARDIRLSDDFDSPGGPWDEHLIPFVFASNARPFLEQLRAKSGIWFCDVRRKDNHARPLEQWYSPDGLQALLKLDEDAANKQLKEEAFDYGFPVRPYQREAIEAVEAGVARGVRSMLIAMATGTGKTKTCVALIYRFLKAKRFRRILFLVDRSALGEQAANAFKDTRMENLLTFAEVFGIKELEDQESDTDTAVHIATVQGMVRRVLTPGDDEAPPPIDTYDCIVVDECHRGYLIDREMSETELGFRGYDDYVSKYRRVIDYFDAVKIGLTALSAYTE